jgi:hypothetical protein
MMSLEDVAKRCALSEGVLFREAMRKENRALWESAKRIRQERLEAMALEESGKRELGQAVTSTKTITGADGRQSVVEERKASDAILGKLLDAQQERSNPKQSVNIDARGATFVSPEVARSVLEAVHSLASRQPLRPHKACEVDAELVGREP